LLCHTTSKQVFKENHAFSVLLTHKSKRCKSSLFFHLSPVSEHQLPTNVPYKSLTFHPKETLHIF
jgi:hypothetical protein